MVWVGAEGLDTSILGEVLAESGSLRECPLNRRRQGRDEWGTQLSAWATRRVAVKIETLWISRIGKVKPRRIRTRKPSHIRSVVPGPEVVEARFCVSFFAGELACNIHKVWRAVVRKDDCRTHIWFPAIAFVASYPSQSPRTLFALP